MRGALLLALAGCVGCAQGITEADPSQVVWVPSPDAGVVAYTMGTRSFCGDDACQPRLDQLPRAVTVAPFELDATEVTLEQYTVWAVKAKATLPSWDYDRRNKPAAVTIDVARAYCQAQQSPDGKPGRLPTEAEWELAARWAGSAQLAPYPWGGDTTRLHSCDVPSLGCGADVSDVGTNPKDVDALGIFDLGGNLPEWVEDDYTPAPACAGATPFAALCGSDTTCVSNACATAMCEKGCAPGVAGAAPATPTTNTPFCAYDPSAPAQPEPLARTTPRVPMYKGGGVGVPACHFDAGMRTAWDQTDVKTSIGFRCAYGRAPAPTVTARLLFKQLPAGTTAIHLEQPGSIAAQRWTMLQVVGFDATRGAFPVALDGNNAYTIETPTAEAPLVVAIQGLPPRAISLPISLDNASGMSCSIAHALDLSGGEPAGGAADEVGESCP